MKPKPRPRQSPADIGKTVRADLADAGLSVMQAAKAFRVTQRTVQNWRAGKTRAPGPVLHLLRMMAGRHLAARGWEGWHLHSGKLWTPEGFGFEPQDGAWWSLLVRQARCFRTAYEEAHQQRQALRQVTASAPAVGREAAHAGGAAVGLVPYKTSPLLDKPSEDQIDVTMASCRIPCECPRPSMPALGKEPLSLESPSTPCFASPSMPTCASRIDLDQVVHRPSDRADLARLSPSEALPIRPKPKPKRQPMSQPGPHLAPSRASSASAKSSWRASQPKPAEGARGSP